VRPSRVTLEQAQELFKTCMPVRLYLIQFYIHNIKNLLFPKKEQADTENLPCIQKICHWQFFTDAWTSGNFSCISQVLLSFPNMREADTFPHLP